MSAHLTLELSTDVRSTQLSVASVDKRRHSTLRATDCLFYLAILCLVLFCTWRAGAFHAEYGGLPDEAGHYVTGLMFHEYLASHHYSSPVAFAENFYLHYPKVAIGHWPPVFYILQAAWTLVFSDSRFSLMFLMAVFAAFLAFTMFKAFSPEFGKSLAFVVSLLFVALPVVQLLAGMVMADILVSLLSFLAALSFGRFIETGQSRDVLIFGLLAIAAIMTKGSALALALLPVVAIVLTRSWWVLRRPALWAAACLVVVVCGPWYWFTRHMSDGAWQQPFPSMDYSWGAFKFYTSQTIHILGWGLACLAAAGFLLKGIQSFRERRMGTWAALIGLFVSFWIVCLVVPTGFGSRYLLPTIPAAMAFALAALVYIAARLRLQRLRPAARPIVLSAVLVALFCTAGFSFPRRQSFGYAPVARLMVSNPRFQNSTILISSDALGEGMFISELAMRQPHPAHIVLRSSKVLSKTDWNGDNYRSLFHTPAQIEQFLESVPITVVLLDDSVPKRDAKPDAKLLSSALIASPDKWKLAGTFPLWRNGVEHPNVLRIYVFTHPVGRPATVLQINMREKLGHSLSFHLDNSAQK